MSNICTRCGKDRVVTKTYKEKVGGSYVTYREMACPDPECQKKVQAVLTKEKDKRVLIKNEQNRREEERKTRIADSRKKVK
jgi:hypothetical protein